jgi:hypothetical protein
VPVPDFHVQVTVSKKAGAALARKKETLVVAAYLSGEPKKGAERYENEIGTLDIGTLKRELSSPGVAHFTGETVSRAALDHLASPDYDLLVNVSSGRHASKDNILSCSIFEGTVEEAAGKTLKISCKLIGE